MGLEARIWASRLGFGTQSWDSSLRPGYELQRGWTEDEEKKKSRNSRKSVRWSMTYALGEISPSLSPLSSSSPSSTPFKAHNLALKLKSQL